MAELIEQTEVLFPVIVNDEVIMEIDLDNVKISGDETILRNVGTTTQAEEKPKPQKEPEPQPEPEPAEEAKPIGRVQLIFSCCSPKSSGFSVSLVKWSKIMQKWLTVRRKKWLKCRINMYNMI